MILSMQAIFESRDHNTQVLYVFMNQNWGDITSFNLNHMAKITAYLLLPFSQDLNLDQSEDIGPDCKNGQYASH